MDLVRRGLYERSENHAHLSSAIWSTMIGVSTLFLVILALARGNGGVPLDLQTLLLPRSRLRPFAAVFAVILALLALVASLNASIRKARPLAQIRAE